jgi:lysophospholipase L1-like esterase
VLADSQHEGWPGKGIGHIQARVNGKILESYQPDVVLLAIGANDMWAKLFPVSARKPISDKQALAKADAYENLVEDILHRLPHVRLVLMVPTTPNSAKRPLSIFRQELFKIAQKYRLNVVDLAGSQNDGVHFTPAGHEQVAGKIFNILSH